MVTFHSYVSHDQRVIHSLTPVAMDLRLRWIWDPSTQKIGHLFWPKSHNEGPRIDSGRNHGRM